MDFQQSGFCKKNWKQKRKQRMKLMAEENVISGNPNLLFDNQKIQVFQSHSSKLKIFDFYRKMIKSVKDTAFGFLEKLSYKKRKVDSDSWHQIFQSDKKCQQAQGFLSENHDYSVVQPYIQKNQEERHALSKSKKLQKQSPIKILKPELGNHPNNNQIIKDLQGPKQKQIKIKTRKQKPKKPIPINIYQRKKQHSNTSQVETIQKNILSKQEKSGSKKIELKSKQKQLSKLRGESQSQKILQNVLQNKQLPCFTKSLLHQKFFDPIQIWSIKKNNQQLEVARKKHRRYLKLLLQGEQAEIPFENNKSFTQENLNYHFGGCGEIMDVVYKKQLKLQTLVQLQQQSQYQSQYQYHPQPQFHSPRKSDDRKSTKKKEKIIQQRQFTETIPPIQIQEKQIQENQFKEVNQFKFSAQKPKQVVAQYNQQISNQHITPKKNQNVKQTKLSNSNVSIIASISLNNYQSVSKLQQNLPKYQQKLQQQQINQNIQRRNPFLSIITNPTISLQKLIQKQQYNNIILNQNIKPVNSSLFKGFDQNLLSSNCKNLFYIKNQNTNPTPNQMPNQNINMCYTNNQNNYFSQQVQMATTQNQNIVNHYPNYQQQHQYNYPQFQVPNLNNNNYQPQYNYPQFQVPNLNNNNYQPQYNHPQFQVLNLNNNNNYQPQYKQSYFHTPIFLNTNLNQSPLYQQNPFYRQNCSLEILGSYSNLNAGSCSVKPKKNKGKERICGRF